MSIKKPMLIQSLITQSGGVINSSKPVEGYTLSYDDRIPLEALDASVQLNIDGASSSASIRLATGTNVDGRAYVEMYTVQGSAGIFRTRSPQIGYGGQNTTLQLEHAINELGDFIITDKIEKEMTLKQAMQKIFEYYGKKSSMWSLGTVDSPNDPDADDKAVKCVLSVDYDNCLDAIDSIMEQYPFMMLTFNFSSFPWKLNVRNKPTIPEAQGRLSRNVKSATVTRDDSEMFNRVYAQKKDGKYGKIDAPDYWKKKYGLIETVISGANDTDAIWKQTVNSYLKTHKKPRYSITIDGIELSGITGESLDKLTLGKMMTLALPDYKTTVSEVITGVSFPSIYKQPNSCTVTLNAEEDKVIKYIKKAQKTAGKASRSAGAVSKAAFVDASVANNVLTLTKGDGSVITFSKAVTLKGSWADGKYTVRAYQNNINTTTKKVEENQVGVPISTVLNGIELQANKSPSVKNTYDLSIPLKVMYNNSGYKGNTEYTQDVVVSALAVYNKGFKDAADRVSLPKDISSGTTQATVTVKFPVYLLNARTTVSQDYAIIPNLVPSADGYVTLARLNSKSVVQGVVARVSIGNWYTAGREDGWDKAFAKVDLPGSKTNDHSFYVKTPAETYNTQTSTTFNLVSHNNNNVDCQKWNGSSWVTVARFTHGKYDSGWGAAYDQVVLPGSGTSSATFYVKTPAETVGAQTSTTFNLVTHNNNNVDCQKWNGSSWVTVARFEHGKYTAGWDAAYGKVSIPGSNTSSAKMTVKVPGSSSGTQSTYEYTVSVSGNNADIKNASNVTVARTSISSVTPTVTKLLVENTSSSPSYPTATFITGLGSVGANKRVYITVSGTRITSTRFYLTT